MSEKSDTYSIVSVFGLIIMGILIIAISLFGFYVYNVENSYIKNITLSQPPTAKNLPSLEEFRLQDSTITQDDITNDLYIAFLLKQKAYTADDSLLLWAESSVGRGFGLNKDKWLAWSDMILHYQKMNRSFEGSWSYLKMTFLIAISLSILGLIFSLGGRIQYEYRGSPAPATGLLPLIPIISAVLMIVAAWNGTYAFLSALYIAFYLQDYNSWMFWVWLVSLPFGLISSIILLNRSIIPLAGFFGTLWILLGILFRPLFEGIKKVCARLLKSIEKVYNRLKDKYDRHIDEKEYIEQKKRQDAYVQKYNKLAKHVDKYMNNDFDFDKSDFKEVENLYALWKNNIKEFCSSASFRDIVFIRYQFGNIDHNIDYNDIDYKEIAGYYDEWIGDPFGINFANAKHYYNYKYIDKKIVEAIKENEKYKRLLAHKLFEKYIDKEVYWHIKNIDNFCKYK